MPMAMPMAMPMPSSRPHAHAQLHAQLNSPDSPHATGGSHSLLVVFPSCRPGPLRPSPHPLRRLHQPSNPPTRLSCTSDPLASLASPHWAGRDAATDRRRRRQRLCAPESGFACRGRPRTCEDMMSKGKQGDAHKRPASTPTRQVRSSQHTPAYHALTRPERLNCTHPAPATASKTATYMAARYSLVRSPRVRM